MNRDALVVGINRYPFLRDSATGEDQHLTTAVDDAEEIAKGLEKWGHFLVRRLPESSNGGQLESASKQLVPAMALEKAITQLFCPRTKNPRYSAAIFAGHGLRKQMGTTEGFLAASDSNPRKGMWGVSLRWLRELLQASPVRQQIVWLDCCYSGEFFNFASSNLQVASSQKLYFFISASRDFEEAYSKVSTSHGALSELLVQGLDPCQSLDGVVSNFTLARFVEQKLTGTPQQPIIQCSNQEILLTCTPGNKHRLYLTTSRELTSSLSISPSQPAFNTPQKTNQDTSNGSDTDSLYRALLCLDYVKQESLFQEFIQTNQVGACLIHGELDYGQRWLLQRLLKRIPTNNTASLTKEFSFLRRVRNGSLDTLWLEIRNNLKLKCQPLPTEIAKEVCNIWQTKTVVLIFDDADQIQESQLEQFLQDFWLPLVNVANSFPPKSRNYRLLLFLVDLDGRANDWSIPFADALDSAWKPHTPIKLRKIEPLSELELSYWLEKAFNDLPRQLTASIEETVKTILAKSQGVHEPAIEHICELCGQDWYEMNRTRYV